MKTVKVQFTPQAWINDYAVTVDAAGPTVFEVPEADAKGPDGEWLSHHDYPSDILAQHRNAPRWIKRHSGPFEIEILHEEEPQP
jgi:hypothetical protein